MSKVVSMPMPRSSCMQVLKEVVIDQWNPQTKKVETAFHTITCDKITEPGEELCPHHILLLREFTAEQDRKMKKARAGKERKKRMREALEKSPLACPQDTTPRMEA